MSLLALLLAISMAAPSSAAAQDGDLLEYVRLAAGILGMEVAQGRMSQADADVRLELQGRDWASRGAPSGELAAMRSQLQLASDQLFGQLEREIVGATSFPGPLPTAVSRALAQRLLRTAGDKLAESLAEGGDPLPALAQMAKVLARVRGFADLPRELDYFAEAAERAERIAASIPPPAAGGPPPVASGGPPGIGPPPGPGVPPGARAGSMAGPGAPPATGPAGRPVPVPGPGTMGGPTPGPSPVSGPGTTVGTLPPPRPGPMAGPGGIPGTSPLPGTGPGAGPGPAGPRPGGAGGLSGGVIPGPTAPSVASGTAGPVGPSSVRPAARPSGTVARPPAAATPAPGAASDPTLAVLGIGTMEAEARLEGFGWIDVVGTSFPASADGQPDTEMILKLAAPDMILDAIEVRSAPDPTEAIWSTRPSDGVLPLGVAQRGRLLNDPARGVAGLQIEDFVVFSLYVQDDGMLERLEHPGTITITYRGGDVATIPIESLWRR